MAAGLAGAVPANSVGAPGMGNPVTPSGAVPPASPSSGLLRAGMAVAGGVAAGMLVDEMLHRHQGSGVEQASGLQGGFFDEPSADNAATELENRSVDFGSGGDWDAGGGGSDGGGWD